MGDDFSLNQEGGVIEPRCEFALQINFRATKAANVKKAIRLEVRCEFAHENMCYPLMLVEPSRHFQLEQIIFNNGPLIT